MHGVWEDAVSESGKGRLVRWLRKASRTDDVDQLVLRCHNAAAAIERLREERAALRRQVTDQAKQYSRTCTDRDQAFALFDLWRLQVAPFGQEHAGHENDQGWCLSCGGGWPCAAVQAEALLLARAPGEPKRESGGRRD